MQMTECLEAFLRAKRAQNLRSVSVNNYSSVLGRFVAFADLGDAGDLTPALIEGYLTALLAAGRRGSGVAQTRNLIISWLSWLYGQGYIDQADWPRAVPTLRYDLPEPTYLSAEQARALIEAAETLGETPLVRRRDPTMISLMLDTALRKGELMRLKRSDISLVDRTVTVSAECKGRRARVVDFGSSTLRLLRAYLRACEAKFGDRSLWLWLTRSGKQLGYNAAYRLVVRAGRRAGIPNLHPHALRHTAATLLLRNDCKLEAVRIILGHSSIAQTMRYVHLCREDVREEWRKASPVDRLLAG